MIKKVLLRNFRNYGYLEVELSEGINSLVGRNGLGKTNFLEALFLLCEGKALRALKVEELIKKGEEEGEVKAILLVSGTESVKKATIKGSGIEFKKSHPRGDVRAIAMLPDDIAFVKSGPEARRKEIDAAISRIKPGYGKDLADYARVVRQRNELLRDIRAGKRAREELHHWNSLLLGLGTRIVEDRLSFLSEIKKAMEEILRRLGKSGLEIRYYSSLRHAEVEESKSFLRRMEVAEIRRGQTMVGPHRDEIIFLLEGRNVRRESSQGEQKIATITWKLALGDLYTERGEDVILLLDDCLSELDDGNAESVLRELESRDQVIITDAVCRSQLLKYRLVDLEGVLRYWGNTID